MERRANARARTPPTIFFCRQTAGARAIITRLSRRDARKCQQPPVPPRARTPVGRALRRHRPIKTVCLTPSHPPSPPTTVSWFRRHYRRRGAKTCPVTRVTPARSPATRSSDGVPGNRCLLILFTVRTAIAPRTTAARSCLRASAYARACSAAAERSVHLDSAAVFFSGNKKRARRFRPAAHGDGLLARGATKNNALPDYYCTRCATVSPPAVPLVRARFTRVPPKPC